MRISVLVNSDEYDALVHHAPEASPASRALSTAAILSHLDDDGIAQAYEVTADDEETHGLLAVAESHCPSAMRKIITAIRQTHLTEAQAGRES